MTTSEPTRRSRRTPPDPLTPGGKIGQHIAALLAMRDTEAKTAAAASETMSEEQRKAAGFTGSRLAELTQIPQSRIANLLLGHVKAPPPARLAKIAEALCVSLADIVSTLSSEELVAYCQSAIAGALNFGGTGGDDRDENIAALRLISPVHADLLLLGSARPRADV